MNQRARNAQGARQTRADQRKQRQEERRLEAERLARRRRLTRIIWWGVGVAALALVIALVTRAVNSSRNTPPDHIAGVISYSNLARTHVAGAVKYPQTPPVGGPHNEVWLNCGIYNAPVANENAVHSLEHGAVWLTYQPNLPASQVSQLHSLVSGHAYTVLSPYPGLPTPVVISAWGLQLRVQSASDPRVAQFIAKYEQGPQTPEPGAACTGGTGTPSS